jgi:hypothetical protein
MNNSSRLVKRGGDKRGGIVVGTRSHKEQKIKNKRRKNISEKKK